MNPVCLHAGNPGPFTGEGNWTYLIPGDTPVLIDAGVGTQPHLDALAAAAPAGPARVLVTHVHSDHASGAPAMRSRWPSAQFSKYPWPHRDAEFAVPWHALRGGGLVSTAEGDLEVLHTPGHSPDHLAFWHADSRTVFVGDLLVLGTTVFIPASSGGCLADYLQSLRTLLALRPLRAWPAHGSVIDDPEALIRHYLDHRQQREDQVLGALAWGLSTVDDITSAIYAGLTSARALMARESVLAHLVKLEDDGRVRKDGQQWAVRR